MQIKWTIRKIDGYESFIVSPSKISLDQTESFFI